MNIRKAEGSLKKVVEAENSEEIFKWLIKRPLMLEIFDQKTDNTFYITLLAFLRFGLLKKL